MQHRMTIGTNRSHISHRVHGSLTPLRKLFKMVHVNETVPNLSISTSECHVANRAR